MKFIRSLHLYLGCLFAPLILLYAASGAWQVYRLNDAAKDGSYTPPAWMKTLSSIHTHQKLEPRKGGSNPVISKAIAAVAGVALAVMALSGIVMAYAFHRNKGLVTIALVAGVVIPAVLLYLQR